MFVYCYLRSFRDSFYRPTGPFSVFSALLQSMNTKAMEFKAIHNPYRDNRKGTEYEKKDRSNNRHEVDPRELTRLRGILCVHAR